jgi:alkylated DNA nucleotide flippase Atl1
MTNVSFRERVFEVVKKIKTGNFLTYKEVAKRAGN